MPGRKCAMDAPCRAKISMSQEDALPRDNGRWWRLKLAYEFFYYGLPGRLIALVLLLVAAVTVWGVSKELWQALG